MPLEFCLRQFQKRDPPDDVTVSSVQYEVWEGNGERKVSHKNLGGYAIGSACFA